ncbi:MAG: transcription termination factor NusA [Phycisphaerae bacterium]
MNQELLRIVDGIARDKNIDKETVFDDLEAAMYTAIRKANSETEDIVVRIDRQSGQITATVDGTPMSVRQLGRIAAQTAKQVMIQRIREAERGSIYEEYLERRGEILTGRVSRWEGSSLIVELGRTEAILPRSEQIPGDSHRPDERIRAMILEVRENPSMVKIVLSRSHPDFIRALFDLEVPEVAEGIIEVKALAREAGYRTKVAVTSLDPKVDAVGACVGMRGSRIRNIVDELGGEKIDIVRWNESSKILIANALKPAEVTEIALCFELGRATVVVTDDQLSLAIGKRGQNVRLAARLTGWDIDILTPKEFNAGLDTLETALRNVQGVDSTVVDKIAAMGMVNVLDIEDVGPEPLINELGLNRDLAQAIVISCAEEARRVAEAQAKAKQAEVEKQAAPQAPAVEQAGESAQQAPAPAASESPTTQPPAGQAVSEQAEAQAVEAAQQAPAPQPQAQTPSAGADPTDETNEETESDEDPNRSADSQSGQ